MLSGIYVRNSSGAKVINNRVDKVGYNGISLANAWSDWMSNGDRIVENNYVSNAMLGLNDGGCIYTYTGKMHDEERDVEPERDIIRNNIVENCIGSYAGTNHVDTSHRAGEGIYLDNDSSYIDIYNNVVVGATKSLFINSRSHDVTATNNNLISPFGKSIYLKESKGKDKQNVFIKHNNVFSGDKWTYQIISDETLGDLLMEIDSNSFRVNSEVMVKEGYGYSVDTNSFSKWQDYGYDTNSLAIKDSTKPIIFINPSLNDVEFSNLQGCREFNNNELGATTIILKPYHSKVLFGCDNYQPGVVKKNENVADTTPPTITLNGTTPQTVEIGENYSDEGATATDNVDGDISSSIVVSSNVDTSKTGTYYIRYNVKDSSGNSASEVVRVVKVVAKVNHAPTYIGNLEDITTQNSQELSIDISNSFSDIDGDNLTYSVENLPNGVSFDSSSKKISGKLSHLASSNSPYNIVIKATDTKGLSATKEITLKVYQIQTHNWAVDKKSEYLKDVTIPSYDSNNPEHFLIKTNSDWSHINDSDKRVFFVSPDVEPKSVTINSSGTNQKPRILTLYTNSNTHPALLDSAKRAKLKALIFANASNWIVDKIAIPNHINESAILVANGCSNIVFNKIYISNYKQAFVILSNQNGSTHDITIQNSKLDSMTLSAIDGDRVAILIAGDPWNEPTVAKNIHILNNEIRNANDGIMPIRHPNASNGHPVDYAGLIIDYNRIYVDNQLYTDGNGNITKDKESNYALTENAIDIKGGSEDANNPVIISNNVLWGFRETDQNGGGSGSWGGAIVVHYNSKNIIIKKNLIFDSNRGIAIADSGGLENASENITIEDNILYDIGKNSPYVMFAYDSKNVLMQRNTIVSKNGATKAYWNSLNSSTTNEKLLCNVIVGERDLEGTPKDDFVINSNYYYATSIKSSDYGISYPNREDAKLEDIIVRLNLFSNNLNFATLPQVLTTTNSPHTKWCKAEDITKEQSISEGRGSVIEPINSSGDSVEITKEPSHGKVFVDFNGTVVYIPDIDYAGSDSYSYKACDIENSANCSNATVNVEV